MTEHTPRSCIICGADTRIHGYNYGACDNCVKAALKSYKLTQGQESLLAAAPDMLAALKWVLDEIKWGHDMIASQAIIEQVISKATGK